MISFLKDKNSLFFPLIFAVTFIISFSLRPDYPELKNYRLDWMVQQATVHYQQYQATGQEPTSINSALNIGANRLYYLFWNTVKNQGAPSKEGEFINIPAAFPLIIKIILFLGVGFFYFNLSLWMGRRFSAIFMIFIVLNPLFRLIAFNLDVYIFDFYSLGIFLGIAYGCFHQENRKKILYLIFLIPIYLFLTFFRDTGLFYSYLLLLFPLILYKSGTREKFKLLFPILIFLLIYSGNFLINQQFPPKHKGHWHAVYVGLFEFGGREHQEQTYFPDFVPYQTEQGDFKKIIHWNDIIAVNVVNKELKRTTEMYSDEYNQILKVKSIELFKSFPGEIITLSFKRFWKMININPFLSYSPDSEISESASDQILKVIFLLLLGFGFWRMIKQRQWHLLILLLLFIPSCLGPLSVHSGYVMYNFCWIVGCYLLVALALREIYLIKSS